MTASLLESNKRTVVLLLQISYPTSESKKTALTKIFLLDLMSPAGICRKSSQLNTIGAGPIKLACSARFRKDQGRMEVGIDATAKPFRKDLHAVAKLPDGVMSRINLKDFIANMEDTI